MITEISELEAKWPELKPKIEAALTHCGGTHNADDVYDALSKAEMQLWTSNGTVIVTQVSRHPRLSEVNLFLIGGNLGDVKVLQERIVAWARDNGFNRIALSGREGWARAWPEFRKRGVFLTKDI